MINQRRAKVNQKKFNKSLKRLMKPKQRTVPDKKQRKSLNMWGSACVCGVMKFCMRLLFKMGRLEGVGNRLSVGQLMSV